MNLFERFWKTLDESREDGGNVGPEAELTLTAVHPPDGVKSEATRDFSALIRKSPRRYPPYVIAQQAFSRLPFCLIVTVAKDELPRFHELFEQYVDKNAFLAEIFLRLRPHASLPYVLFLGENSYYLYDSTQEEVLRWGNDFTGLDELFFQPLASRRSIAELWQSMPRKSRAQRAEEFSRWLDLWKAAIGVRTSATPAFMQNLMQKVILVFLYDEYFGLGDAELRLRTQFLEHRAAAGKKPRAGKAASLPFDGIAWLHEAAQEIRVRHDIHFLEWTTAESTFFSLLGGETRFHFSQFVLELFLLSRSKFDIQVQADAFSDAESRMKLWRFAVTETLDIRQRLQADAVNVYEPISVDLEDSGIGWALHVVQQTIGYWHDQCNEFTQQLSQRKKVGVQFDMFLHQDLEHAHAPRPEDIFETAFGSCIRVHYNFPIEKASLEYLLILAVYGCCREWNIPMQPLHSLEQVFCPKERIGQVQEM